MLDVRPRLAADVHLLRDSRAGCVGLHGVDLPGSPAASCLRVRSTCCWYDSTVLARICDCKSSARSEVILRDVRVQRLQHDLEVAFTERALRVDAS